MPRDLEPSLVESNFLLSALEQKHRLDQRDFDAYRPLALSFSPDEYGQTTASIGSTRVMAQVSADVVKPNPDRPQEGLLACSCEVSPLAGPAHELGRASEEETQLARSLEKALRDSGAVDREALCMVAGQKVWAIRIDIRCLDDHGNLLDCACFAAMAALRHFRKPEVTLDGDTVIVHSYEERVPVPLAISHSPFCLTYAFFPSAAVLDPSRIEAQLADGTLSLTLNAQGEICIFSKVGGSPMGVDELMRCVNVASVRVKELEALVKKELDADAKRRRLTEGDGGKGADLEMPRS